MTTFDLLAKINDTVFEQLAAGYLRRQVPHLAMLIGTGINERGEPIPCPVDSILHIPGNPSRCVAVAATTTKRDELRRKWLGNASKKGDIDKAITEFASWRRDDPDVECKLYLATSLPYRNSEPMS